MVEIDEEFYRKRRRIKMRTCPLSKHKQSDMVLTLFNKYVKYSRCVGYCWKHHVYITKDQMNLRLCASRDCHSFEKLLNQSYWKIKANKKKNIAKRKEEMNAKLERALSNNPKYSANAESSQTDE